jgi:hypothetical protein
MASKFMIMLAAAYAERKPFARLLRCSVGEKCSRTPSTLRFSASSRLALEQNCSFLDGHYPIEGNVFLAVPASSRVNRPKNDDPSVIEQTDEILLSGPA